MSSGDDGFLSRWSRRKQQARGGAALPPEAPAPVEPPPAPALTAAPVPQPADDLPAPLKEQAEPLPTLEDVERLTPASDYARFVAPSVDPAVKNAALRKLFTDPHYNVMDGLDIYIDDYNKSEPIPPEMLRQMVQSKFLGLFDDEETREDAAQAAGDGSAPVAHAPAPADNPVPHEDADLRLQQDDVAGRPDPEPDPGSRAG